MVRVSRPRTLPTRSRRWKNAPKSLDNKRCYSLPWRFFWTELKVRWEDAWDGPYYYQSHAEGEVLRLFLESPKRLISRARMQETLGGAAGESFDRAMDVRISRLRTKLREDPKNPRLLKTIYGAGYIFLGDVEWT